MPFDPQLPYNDLPLLPPKVELETKEILKKAISANTALAELKGAGELIPNQSVLVQAIGLQEAKFSSEIENIVTTDDELYRAFANEGHKTDPHTKEVLRYNKALWYGYDLIKTKKRPLATNVFEELYRIIKQTEAGVRKTPGTKLANSRKRIIYTPPEGESILRDKLGNLEKKRSGIINNLPVQRHKYITFTNSRQPGWSAGCNITYLDTYPGGTPVSQR